MKVQDILDVMERENSLATWIPKYVLTPAIARGLMWRPSLAFPSAWPATF